MISEKEEIAISKSNDDTVAIQKPVGDASINALNLFNQEELAAAENFLRRIVATEKGGIKTINEGIALMMRSKDLGLPFSSCIEHIHIINGKTGIDIHIIKSLLVKAGVTWELIKDYAPLYEYTDANNVYTEDKLPDYCIKCKNKKIAEELQEKDPESVGVWPVKYYSDFNGVVYKEYQLNSKFAIAVNQITAKEIANSGKIPIYRIPAVPIDYVTTYKFTRYRIINGREVITTGTSHFSYSDAVAAELFDKDTYKKYARIMIGNRAFTYGARDIAPDALMGCYETSELKIINKVPLSADDVIDVEEIKN